MLVQNGYYYHIKDDFFNFVNDSALMSNYDNGSYRPHFLAVADSSYSDIYWMIPVSSKYTKYNNIINAQVKKYGRCTKIVLGKCGSKDAAFLIQNAFPITSDYFDHIHTSQGQPLRIHKNTYKTIVSYLNNNLQMKKHGVNLFYPDIDRIYSLMINHLKDAQ